MRIKFQFTTNTWQSDINYLVIICYLKEVNPRVNARESVCVSKLIMLLLNLNHLRFAVSNSLCTFISFKYHELCMQSTFLELFSDFRLRFSPASEPGFVL